MKKTTYNISKFFIKKLYKDRIVGKAMKLFPKTKLYYEVSQHMTFFSSKQINYEPEICGFINKFISEKSVIFDIGCNVGQYMLLFANWAKLGKVYSFEPDPKNFAFALFNKQINQLDNIFIENVGIGDKNESIQFYRDSITGGRRGSFKKEFVGDSFSNQTIKVSTRKFSELVVDYGIPDFVKVDVEGFEEKVVLGMGEISAKTVFLIEVRLETKKNIFNFFKERGFICKKLDEGLPQEMKSYTEIPSFANLLFVHPSHSSLIKNE